MSTPVKLPELGESVTEGTITRWLKQVGDTVEVDEPLLEVSTDKVDTEIPSPVAGTLLEIKAEEDETVEVGAELCVIGDEGEGGGSDSGSDEESGSEDSADEAEEESGDESAEDAEESGRLRGVRRRVGGVDEERPKTPPTRRPTRATRSPRRRSRPPRRAAVAAGVRRSRCPPWASR